MSNLKKIEGGVTTPQGFTAGAVYTAIKKRENKKPEQVLRSSGHPCPRDPEKGQGPRRRYQLRQCQRRHRQAGHRRRPHR